MNVYGLLTMAQLQTIAGGPTAALTGHIAYASTADKVQWADGSKAISILSNDDHCVIGTNVTLANNIRLNRAANEVLQFLTADDTTAEGSISADGCAQISFRAENYATGSLPTSNAANAGRIMYDSTLKKVIYDNGAALTTLQTEGTATSLTSLSIADTDASHDLAIVWNEDDIADRTLNLLVNYQNRSISLSGDVTIGGAFTTSGLVNFAAGDDTIIRVTASTDVTFPTEGTLATLDGTETFTNKTLTTPDINSPDIDGGTADSLTSLSIKSTGAEHDLTITTNTVFTAGKTLTVIPGDANRSLTFEGDTIVSQDYSADAVPTFAGITRASADLTIGTTTSGDVNLNPVDELYFSNNRATNSTTINTYFGDQTGGATGIRSLNGAMQYQNLGGGWISFGTTIAVNDEISSSCSFFSTNSQTFVDVTNLSVSITTNGRPVEIRLIPDGGSSPAYIGSSNNHASTEEVIVKALRDSTSIGVYEQGNGDNTANVITTKSPVGSIYFYDTPSAGTYTYKLQMRVSATLYCSGYLYYAKLLVRELSA